jgi:hypothetical protein
LTWKRVVRVICAFTAQEPLVVVGGTVIVVAGI